MCTQTNTDLRYVYKPPQIDGKTSQGRSALPLEEYTPNPNPPSRAETIIPARPERNTGTHLLHPTCNYSSNCINRHKFSPLSITFQQTLDLTLIQTKFTRISANPVLTSVINNFTFQLRTKPAALIARDSTSHSGTGPPAEEPCVPLISGTTCNQPVPSGFHTTTKDKQSINAETCHTSASRTRGTQSTKMETAPGKLKSQEPYTSLKSPPAPVVINLPPLSKLGTLSTFNLTLL